MEEEAITVTTKETFETSKASLIKKDDVFDPKIRIGEVRQLSLNYTIYYALMCYIGFAPYYFHGAQNEGRFCLNPIKGTHCQEGFLQNLVRIHAGLVTLVPALLCAQMHIMINGGHTKSHKVLGRLIYVVSTLFLGLAALLEMMNTKNPNLFSKLSRALLPIWAFIALTVAVYYIRKGDKDRHNLFVVCFAALLSTGGTLRSGMMWTQYLVTNITGDEEYNISNVKLHSMAAAAIGATLLSSVPFAIYVKHVGGYRTTSGKMAVLLSMYYIFPALIPMTPLTVLTGGSNQE